MNQEIYLFIPVVIQNSSGIEYGLYKLPTIEKDKILEFNVLGLLDYDFYHCHVLCESISELCQIFHADWQGTSKNSQSIILWDTKINFSFVDRGVRPSYAFVSFRKFKNKEKHEFITKFNGIVECGRVFKKKK